MNRKQLMAIFIIFFFTALLYAEQEPPITASKDYEVIRHKGEFNRLILTYKNSAIYEIVPKYVDTFQDASNDEMRINLIYNKLVPRSLSKDIIPFEDITGDSIPDLVVIENPPPGNWYAPFVVRVLSTRGSSVTEYSPIEGGGEVYYFADFNKDGILEFVNTDSEGDFVYDDTGMPISDYVWVLDKESNKYARTSSLSVKSKLDE